MQPRPSNLGHYFHQASTILAYPLEFATTCKTQISTRASCVGEKKRTNPPPTTTTTTTTQRRPDSSGSAEFLQRHEQKLRSRAKSLQPSGSLLIHVRYVDFCPPVACQFALPATFSQISCHSLPLNSLEGLAGLRTWGNPRSHHFQISLLHRLFAAIVSFPLFHLHP